VELLEVKWSAGRWKLVTGFWRRDTGNKMMPAVVTLVCDYRATGKAHGLGIGFYGLRAATAVSVNWQLD